MRDYSNIDWTKHIDEVSKSFPKLDFPKLIAKELCSVQPMTSDLIGNFYKIVEKTKFEFFKEEEFEI